MGRSNLTAADKKHRKEFATYARRHGHGPYRPVLRRLYSLWERWNRELFDGKLVTPHILLAEPKSPRALGDHAELSGWGSRNQIRIRPSLYDGTHPAAQAGDEFQEGRFLLVADVLLHETIHQYHDEVSGLTEPSYHGHGPAFRDECNRVGALLNLPPVRTAKARGKDRPLPSCAQWPLNVRPADYYQGAYLRVPTPQEEQKPVPADGHDHHSQEATKTAADLLAVCEYLSEALTAFEAHFDVTPEAKLGGVRLLEGKVLQEVDPIYEPNEEEDELLSIFTIGYGGKTRDELIGLLLGHSIQAVADIRKHPERSSMGMYMKAKTPSKGIEKTLADAGIGYEWFGELGNDDPKDPKMKVFRALIEKSADSATKRLVEVASEKKVCLLCAEKDPRACHRSIITDYLETQGWKIVHL